MFNQKMLIAFYIERMSIRGTCIAIYDYAHYNEILLGNKSIIVYNDQDEWIINNLYNENEQDCRSLGITKFSRRFETRIKKNEQSLDDVINDCDILYCIAHGKDNGLASKKIKTIIHCVFDMSEKHGDLYIGVSRQLANKYGYTEDDSYLDHMIALPPSIHKDNLRKELNIPGNAIVFGRYGGYDTFILTFVHDVVKRIVNERSDVYFVFINTKHFYDHPHIFYLNLITDHDEKNRFISTCDAYIEASHTGHSFGLSIGEFSVNNKPIIVLNSPDYLYPPNPISNLWNDSHIKILGDKGLYYTNADELYEILTTFNPKDYKNVDLNCYKDYSPIKIMKKFQHLLTII